MLVNLRSVLTAPAPLAMPWLSGNRASVTLTGSGRAATAGGREDGVVAFNDTFTAGARWAAAPFWADAGQGLAVILENKDVS